MALTGYNRGVTGNTTAATTLVMKSSNNFTAGSLAVLCVQYDNAGSGGADCYSGITDSLGNTWTSEIRTLQDPAAASAGCVGAIFTTNQNAGTIQTTTNITLGFTASVTAKAWTLMEITAASGYKARVVTDSGAAYTSASPTITTGTIAVGHMTIGMAGGEGNSTTRTGDSDTTNGSWSTAQQAGYGTTTSGIQIITQFKIQTTTDSSQTYNPTFTTSHDGAINWMEIEEAPLLSPTTYFMFLD